MRINIDSETEGVNFILQTTVMCHHRSVGHIMDMRPAPCANQTKCAKEKHLLSLSRGKMFVLVALNESCSPAKYCFTPTKEGLQLFRSRYGHSVIFITLLFCGCSQKSFHLCTLDIQLEILVDDFQLHFVLIYINYGTSLVLDG